MPGAVFTIWSECRLRARGKEPGPASRTLVPGHGQAECGRLRQGGPAPPALGPVDTAPWGADEQPAAETVRRHFLTARRRAFTDPQRGRASQGPRTGGGDSVTGTAWRQLARSSSAARAVALSHSEHGRRGVSVNERRRRETSDSMDPQEVRPGAGPGRGPHTGRTPCGNQGAQSEGLGRAPRRLAPGVPRSRRSVHTVCTVRSVHSVRTVGSVHSVLTVRSLQAWAGDGLGAARSPPSAASVAWRLAVASTRSPFRTGNRRAGREVAMLLPEKAVSISSGGRLSSRRRPASFPRASAAPERGR